MNFTHIPVKNTHQCLIVEEQDAHLLKGRSWALATNGYINCKSLVSDKYDKKVTLYPQRLVMGLEPGDGLVVDFIDHNPFNLVRSNLRVCTQAESAKNRRKGTKPMSSRYKGVSWKDKGWQVAIRMNGKVTHVGRFQDEEDAARAYDRAAIQAHGQYSHLNFPLKEEAQCLHTRIINTP